MGFRRMSRRRCFRETMSAVRIDATDNVAVARAASIRVSEYQKRRSGEWSLCSS
jgi:hypothetical protein